MREEFRVLLEQLEADLNKIELEPDPMKRLGRCLEHVEVTIAKIPEREDFEIYYGHVGFLYIKELMPQLFRKLLHYHLLFDLELYRTCSTNEEYARYCEDKLGEMRKWLDDNINFVKYYYSKAFEGEEWYVLSENRGRIPEVLKSYLKFPFQHESAGLVATILAYTDFSKVLKAELEGPDSTLEPAEWKRQVNELVEQILGEYATEHTVVGGKPATQEYLVARAQKMYPNVSLKNFDSIAGQIRAREVRAKCHLRKIELINDRADELLVKEKANKLKSKKL